MAPQEIQNAINAARAAVWSWTRSSGRIRIEAEPGSVASGLDGEWTVSDFTGQVDGISRGLVERLTTNGEPGLAIDETFQLKDGASVRFVGAFVDASAARGLIYSDQTGRQNILIDTSGLEPVYQTIIDAHTGKVAGFEALARWRGSGGELIGPDDLSNDGRSADWTQIAPIMVDASAGALSRFRDVAGDVFMQVNLSAAEIGRAYLVRETEAAIKNSGLPRGALRIELTEQAALRDVDRALGALAALRAAGAGLVLDDFGAGHSSLVWLIDIPADGVKLDQQMTAMITRPRGFMVIRAMVRLAHELKLTVTAEGVETEAQATALREAECDFLQGWLFGTPKVEAEVLADLTCEQVAD